jgi:hypothetical protein
MTHTVHWHGFGGLPSEQGEFVDSPDFMLLENEWHLAIFPGGSANAVKEWSLYLWKKSDKAIEIDGNRKKSTHTINP